MNSTLKEKLEILTVYLKSSAGNFNNILHFLTGKYWKVNILVTCYSLMGIFQTTDLIVLPCLQWGTCTLHSFPQVYLI